MVGDVEPDRIAEMHNFFYQDIKCLEDSLGKTNKYNFHSIIRLIIIIMIIGFCYVIRYLIEGCADGL